MGGFETATKQLEMGQPLFLGVLGALPPKQEEQKRHSVHHVNGRNRQKSQRIRKPKACSVGQAVEK